MTFFFQVLFRRWALKTWHGAEQPASGRCVRGYCPATLVLQSLSQVVVKQSQRCFCTRLRGNIRQGTSLAPYSDRIEDYMGVKVGDNEGSCRYDAPILRFCSLPFEHLTNPGCMDPCRQRISLGNTKHWRHKIRIRGIGPSWALRTLQSSIIDRTELGATRP